VLHGNRSQGQRKEALAGFKEGRYEVMVATDIAARGLDVADVSHVINYDIPMTPSDYVHRIGRTGRAAAVGDAFTLVTPEDASDLRAIEKFINAKIPVLKLEGFDYDASPPPPAHGQTSNADEDQKSIAKRRKEQIAAAPLPPVYHPKGKPGAHWQKRGRR
jgi:ATP-dependent RNA helicase RhlE